MGSFLNNLRNQILQTKPQNYFDAFQTANWNKLDETQRLKALQWFENYTAQQQGRPARTVDPDPKLENGSDKVVRGYYSRENPDKLFINKSILNSNESGSSYQLMNTVLHEGRHAYQHDCVRGEIVPGNGVTTEQVAQWRRNFLSYNNAKETGYISYRYQPIEADANRFAHQKMMEFNQYYLNDPHYSRFLQSVEQSNRMHSATAQQMFGRNYEQVIADGVDWNYAQKHMKNVQNDTQADAGKQIYNNRKAGEPAEEFSGKAFSVSYDNEPPAPTLRIPKNSGRFLGEPGNSEFVPNDERTKKALAEYGADSVKYVNGEPDFSPFATHDSPWGKINGTVEIPHMTGNRNNGKFEYGRRDYGQSHNPNLDLGNFEQADNALAERLKASPEEIERYRKDNKLVWHERSDGLTMDLVPNAINNGCPHTGGVAEQKYRMALSDYYGQQDDTPGQLSEYNPETDEIVFRQSNTPNDDGKSTESKDKKLSAPTEEDALTKEIPQTEEKTPAKEDAPTKEAPQTEEKAPTEEDALTKEIPQTEEKTPAKEDAPTKEAPQTEEKTPAKEDTPTKEAPQTEEKTPAKEDAPTKEAPQTEEKAPAKEDAPTKEAPQTEEKAPAKEDTPTKEAPQTKEKAPAKENKPAQEESHDNYYDYGMGYGY